MKKKLLFILLNFLFINTYCQIDKCKEIFTINELIMEHESVQLYLENVCITDKELNLKFYFLNLPSNRNFKPIILTSISADDYSKIETEGIDLSREFKADPGRKKEFTIKTTHCINVLSINGIYISDKKAADKMFTIRLKDKKIERWNFTDTTKCTLNIVQALKKVKLNKKCN